MKILISACLLGLPGRYDGTFTGTLTAGDGVTAALLRAHGIRVLGESQVLELLAPDGEKP